MRWGPWGRLGWGAVDQGLSSLTNAVLAIAVARSVDTAGVGAFGVVFAVYAIAVGLARSVATDPLLVRATVTGRPDRDTVPVGADAATGTALVAGGVGSLLVLATAVLGPDVVRGPFLVLAVALPALLLHDAWRGVLFAAGRPGRAAASDAVWAVVQLVGVVLLGVTERADLVTLLLAWAVAGAAAAVVAGRAARARPAPRSSPAWWRAHRDLALPFAGEYVATQGSTQATLWIAAATVGLGVVGAVRAGMVLVGPVALLLVALPLVAVPEAVRLRVRAGTGERRFLRRVSIGLVLAAVVWTLLLLAAPDVAGEAVVGESWDEARAVVVPLGALVASGCANAGAVVGLRARGAARESLAVRAGLAPVVVAAGVVGGLVAGAPGLVWGLAAVHWVGTWLWWRTLRTATATEGSGSARPGEDPATAERGGAHDGPDPGRSRPSTS